MPTSGNGRPQGARRDDAAAGLAAARSRTRAPRSSRGSRRRSISAAAAHPNPGRPLVHRLNRAEYANAIRDLLALDVDASALLPPDDAAYGFDNIADALGVSPVLLERYLAAAGKISSLAVGDPDTRPGRRDVPHPAGRVAGHSHRGPADRHRRRHPREDDAAARRHVRLLDQAASARTSASCAASSTSTSSNTPSTASACTCLDGRRRGRLQGQPEEHDEGGRRRRGAGARPHPAEGRPARHHGGVPRADATRSTRCGCSRSSAARTTRSTRSAIRISTRSR